MRGAAFTPDCLSVGGDRGDRGGWLTGRGLWAARSIWLLFGGVSVAGGVFAALLFGGEGRVHVTGVPSVQLPLPDPAPLAEVEPDAMAASRPVAAAPVLRALVEDGPFGPLPRIGPDGRRPLLAYARPFDLADRRPRIAILVVGLGLQADLTEAAIRLPGEISLQFSAYAADLPSWVERARRAGHEVLLELPMEPLDYPGNDPGPHTLLAGNPTEDNLKRLDWLLARATGYIAVAGSGARFASSEGARPVLEVLARRGLAVIELGRTDLAASATAFGLPYASAPSAIDADPSSLPIDYALAGLEAEALQNGSALGIAQSYPVSLERVRLWAASLHAKGLALAPVSAVVIEQSGLSTEVGDARGRDRAQG